MEKKIRILNSIIVLLFSFCIIEAKEYKDEIEDFKIIKVRDGDTFVITIPNIPDVFGEEIAVRVRGIDTPEKRD